MGEVEQARHASAGGHPTGGLAAGARRHRCGDRQGRDGRVVRSEEVDEQPGADRDQHRGAGDGGRHTRSQEDDESGQPVPGAWSWFRTQCAVVWFSTRCKQGYGQDTCNFRT
jgi:hypothetical protein